MEQRATFDRVPVRITRSQRAGVIFPVGRLHRYLKHSTPFLDISLGAPIYLAAVLDYLCSEILELAGNTALARKRRRITPRHVNLALQNDAELRILIDRVIIPTGGVYPRMHVALLPAFRPGRSGPASQAWAFQLYESAARQRASNVRSGRAERATAPSDGTSNGRS
jgi:histone H2A